MTSSLDHRAVQEHLTAELAIDTVAGVARAALWQRSPRVDCPAYLAGLTTALAEDYPPFGTEEYADVYRAAAENGQWLAISLMTNSEREGDGAKRLWSLAACSPDGEEKQLLKRHAVDESRHALAYLALLDLCFPGAVTPEFRTQLNDLSPHWSMAQDVYAVENSPYAHAPSIDDYIQMNIAEIRTTIHHTLQREAIGEHCPPENHERATNILDSLMRDELNHVGYTAELIERRSKSMEPAKFQALFTRRLRDFSAITREELGQLKFE